MTAPGARVRARKRDAITQAARLVFGRQGYSRTSIDAIAAEAGVSTRTIYNHFPGKEHLFASVLTASATQVATSVVEGAAVAFAEPLDVERALVGLGRLLAAQQTAFPEHFAMVRQIDAERAHFPDSVFEAWQDAGPRRVRAEVVARLGGLAQQGFLTLDEVERAALHFVVLTTAEVLERFRRHGAPPDEKETAEMVSTGVAAFLRGYGN